LFIAVISILIIPAAVISSLMTIKNLDLAENTKGKN